MYDTLLFLHVLSAFALVAGVVIFSAAALGAAIGPGPQALAEKLTAIGGGLVLVFGVWIALREDYYDITDGWILGAIVLWVVATGTGIRAGKEAEAAAAGPTTGLETAPAGAAPVAAGIPAKAAMFHWIAAASTVTILILMVWKPGA